LKPGKAIDGSEIVGVLLPGGEKFGLAVASCKTP
jgi:hypothetical protein